MPNMQDMQNMQNMQNFKNMQIMQNMVKLQNISFFLLFPLRSSSHIPKYHEVQCLHSISRTCLAQEFGLVMVLIIEKFQNERTSVAKSLFPSQGEGDNCPKVYNANQQDIDKDGEKQFGSSAPCLLCFFLSNGKKGVEGQTPPIIENSNYLNSETF